MTAHSFEMRIPCETGCRAFGLVQPAPEPGKAVEQVVAVLTMALAEGRRMAEDQKGKVAAEARCPATAVAPSGASADRSALSATDRMPLRAVSIPGEVAIPG